MWRLSNIQPADEMGEVIGAFNEMQVKLGEEARRNREALEHVDRLYNETPALMFSIDSSGADSECQRPLA